MAALQTVSRDLLRSAPFHLVRSSDGEAAADGRSLTGYAAVFGQPTEIDSWEGQFIETIRKGAFRKSVRERTPVLQFDHGRHPLIGSIPIGAITDLGEDDQGLSVGARITDNWLMQPIRDAIAEESINGMSFRFEVVREQWRDKDGKLLKPEEVPDLLWMPGDRGPLQRELIELKVPELGPVVFPAYSGTSVSVRARGMAAALAHDDNLTREIRQSLARDATGPQVPEDPELRREVATALLFRDDAPPADGHLSERNEPNHGAPLGDEHPPKQKEDSDAPPADGHPSTPESPSRDALRRNITEVRAEMAAHLADLAEQGRSPIARGH